VKDARAPVDAPSEGELMYRLAEELFPICRSITGDGLRRTLRRIANEIPLEVREVPTGTPVFDWTVPPEWNIRDAYVKGPNGTRVIDFQRSSLHVVGYSPPVQVTMSLDELRPHLHTLPDQPDWIPYRTSYYTEQWGFCLSERQLQSLPDGPYEVCIDSTLAPGHLSYGECVLPGEREDEVLLSCHCCHPALANDNLSGIAMAVALAKRLQATRRCYTYRLLFIPGTIGSITWLALNEATTGRVRHGLVLSCLGDRGWLTYKRSRRGDALVDRAAGHVLGHCGGRHAILDFSPYGYDERQYCSPGFDLAVGCLTRTPNGGYPEYHTSADDLALIDATHLADSLARAWEILEVLECNATFVNLNPKCEPQLGRRGLYGTTGGHRALPGYQMAMLWVLNLSDGGHDLLAIADRAGIPFHTIHSAAEDLVRAGLLAPAVQS